jgi:hypothetical protein
VLLAGAADARDAREVEATRLDALEQKVERRDPHLRIAVLHPRVGVLEEAVRRTVLGKVIPVVDARVEDDLSFVRVDDERGEALGAGVETEVEGHGVRSRGSGPGA